MNRLISAFVALLSGLSLLGAEHCKRNPEISRAKDAVFTEVRMIVQCLRALPN
jgi:hypothetical protein